MTARETAVALRWFDVLTLKRTETAGGGSEDQGAVKDLEPEQGGKQCS